jgi:hypothetical protein
MSRSFVFISSSYLCLSSYAIHGFLNLKAFWGSVLKRATVASLTLFPLTTFAITLPLVSRQMKHNYLEKWK